MGRACLPCWPLVTTTLGYHGPGARASALLAAPHIDVNAMMWIRVWAVRVCPAGGAAH